MIGKGVSISKPTVVLLLSLMCSKDQTNFKSKRKQMNCTIYPIRAMGIFPIGESLRIFRIIEVQEGGFDMKAAIWLWL